MSRRLLLGLSLLAGCSPAAPEARPPAPAPAPAAAQPDACDRAAALRKEAAGLLDATRLFRAELALNRADTLCPRQSSQGWASWLRLYRHRESNDAIRGLLAVLRAAESVPEDALALAREIEAEQRKEKDEPPQTEPDPALVLALERKAEEAVARRQWKTAAEHFGETFRASRRDHYRRLQGAYLLRAGEKSAGQKLIDIAVASSPSRRPTLGTTFGKKGPGMLLARGALFLADEHSLSEFSPISGAERQLIEAPELGVLGSLATTPSGDTLAVIGSQGLSMLAQQTNGLGWRSIFDHRFERQPSAGGRFINDELFATHDGAELLWSRGFQNWDRLMLPPPWDSASGVNSLERPLTVPLAEPNSWFVLRPAPLPGLPISRKLLTSSRGEPPERTVVSNDGALIAASASREVFVFDSTTRRRLWSRAGKAPISGLQFIGGQRLVIEQQTAPHASPNEMVVGGDTQQLEVEIVDGKSGRDPLRLEPVLARPEHRTYRLEATTLRALGSELVSWNIHSGKALGRGAHACEPGARLELVEARPLCLEVDQDKGEFLRDATSGERAVLRPRAHHHVGLVALSPGAEALAALDQGGVLHRFDLRNGAWRAYPPADEVTSLDPNTHLALSAGGDAVAWTLVSKKGKTRVSAARAGQDMTSVELPDNQVASLAASSAQLLLCQRQEKPVTVYQLPDLSPAPGFERLLDKDPALRCALSPDGRLHACAERFGEITLRDAASGRTTAALRATPLVGAEATGTSNIPTERLIFSGDSRVLAAASSHEIQLWSVEQASLIGAIPLPHQQPAIALSHDGRRLAVASSQMLALFGTPWGQPLAMVSHQEVSPLLPQTLLFSGERAIAMSQRGLVSIDDSGNHPRVAHTGQLNGLGRRAIDAAPKARLVAVSTASGLELIDPERGELRATLRLLRKGAGWYVTTPEGLSDWGGDPTALALALSCRVAESVLPFEACEDHLRVPGLLGQIARGQHPSLLPE